jgi:hypothetical protein
MPAIKNLLIIRDSRRQGAKAEASAVESRVFRVGVIPSEPLFGRSEGSLAHEIREQEIPQSAYMR